FLEAPQTMDELVAMPKQVKGPCLLNVVRGGKTPEIDLPRAAELGFAIAIVPGLLMATVIGACDQALAALKRDMRHPPLAVELSPSEMFGRVGADEWDPRRTQYRE